jgi:thiamine-phosphate pyrophosphorylase
MKDVKSWAVYLVTDRSFSQGRSTAEIVTAALAGGVSAVQLREKDLCTRDFYQEGLPIRGLLRANGVALIINDRIDIALALDADGVHLGQDDMPLEEARRILGPDRIIGLSVNDMSHINSENEALADYFAISPVFPTPTKTDTTEPWGLEGIRKARVLTDLPLIAIGSIKLHNVRAVVDAGADSVAVVTAITAASDPAEATRELVQQVKLGKSCRKYRV